MTQIPTSASHRKLYAILGLAQTCTTEQIKAQFRCISRTYHPDILGYSHPLYEEARYAYGVLIDPVARQIYDSTTDDANTKDLRAQALGIIRAFTTIIIEQDKGLDDVKALMQEYLSHENNAQHEQVAVYEKTIKNSETLICSLRERMENSDQVRDAMINMANEQIGVANKEINELKRRMQILETASVLMAQTTYKMPPLPPVIHRDYRTMTGWNLEDLIGQHVMITFPFGGAIPNPPQPKDDNDED